MTMPNKARAAIFGLVIRMGRKERDKFRLDCLFDQAPRTGAKHIAQRVRRKSGWIRQVGDGSL